VSNPIKSCLYLLFCCSLLAALAGAAAGQSLDTVEKRRQWLLNRALENADALERTKTGAALLSHARLTLGRDLEKANRYYETLSVEFAPGEGFASGNGLGWHDFESTKVLKALLDFEHSGRLSAKALANLKAHFVKWAVADPTLAKDADRVARWPVIYTENHDVMHLTIGLFREVFAGRDYREQVRQISRWIDWRLERGFYEWHSPQYAIHSLNPLLTLAEHAPEEALRAKARTLINAQLAERALLSVNGYTGGPFLRGASFINTVERDTYREVMWVAFGLGEPPRQLATLFTLSSFEPHKVVSALAREWDQRGEMVYRGSRHFRGEDGNYQEGQRRLLVTYYNTPHVSMGAMNINGYAYQSRGFNIIFPADPRQTLLTYLPQEPPLPKCKTDQHCARYEVAQHKNWLISRGRLVANGGLAARRQGPWNLYRVGRGLCAHYELPGDWHVFQVSDLDKWESEEAFIRGLTVPVKTGETVKGRTTDRDEISVDLTKMELSVKGQSQQASDWKKWLHDHPAMRSLYGSGRVEITSKAGSLVLDRSGLR
jgi:hypothetical protein